jgi:hypothetical protein
MKLTTAFRTILLAGAVLSCQPGFAQTIPASTPAPVRAWYAAWFKNDWNMMTQCLGDGFTFSSPLDDHLQLATFKERCWPNAGHIKKYEIEKLIVDGASVMVISTGWSNNDKSFRNCDYFQLKNGKIMTYECFFGPGINFPNSGK